MKQIASLRDEGRRPESIPDRRATPGRCRHARPYGDKRRRRWANARGGASERACYGGCRGVDLDVGARLDSACEGGAEEEETHE
jgi:hypothetical protein